MFLLKTIYFTLWQNSQHNTQWRVEYTVPLQHKHSIQLIIVLRLVHNFVVTEDYLPSLGDSINAHKALLGTLSPGLGLEVVYRRHTLIEWVENSCKYRRNIY